MSQVRRRWGIEQLSPPSVGLGWIGPLGVDWMRPHAPKPSYTDDWPASFRTRAQAQAMAKHLTAFHVERGWRFRPCRLAIMVTQS